VTEILLATAGRSVTTLGASSLGDGLNRMTSRWPMAIPTPCIIERSTRAPIHHASDYPIWIGGGRIDSTLTGSLPHVSQRSTW
jgi:hypothetical protein